MKRILVLTIMLLNLTVLGIVHAAYPDYYNGDKNYPICSEHKHGGFAQFIDMSSVKVEAINDSEYKISVRLIGVPDADRGNLKIARDKTDTWVYNIDELKMYYKMDKGLTYVPPVGIPAMIGLYYPGEMAFYIATGEKFYGGKQWFNPKTQKYEKADCDNDHYYEVIDKARK